MLEPSAQSNSLSSNFTNEDDVKRCLTFVVHGEVYGIDILNIKEIVDLGNITKVPMMPDFVAGVINLRGSVVPVIELASRFSFKPSKRSKKSSIVILECKDEGESLELGILVEQVNEVLDIDSSFIEPAPAFGTNIRTDFICGMGKVNGQLLVLLDIDQVLAIDELSSIEVNK